MLEGEKCGVERFDGGDRIILGHNFEGDSGHRKVNGNWQSSDEDQISMTCFHEM